MSQPPCEMQPLGHSAVGEIWRCCGCGRFQLRLPDASLHLGADAFEELFELVVLARARSRQPQAPAWPVHGDGMAATGRPDLRASAADEPEGPAPTPSAWHH